MLGIPSPQKALDPGALLLSTGYITPSRDHIQTGSSGFLQERPDSCKNFLAYWMGDVHVAWETFVPFSILHWELKDLR